MAGEKRSAEELTQHQDQSVIILDVEGTTSSISFVKDTLFPYVREHLKKHITEKWDDEEFKADLAKLKTQAKEDEEQKLEGFVAIKDGDDDEAKETVVKNVLWQMDNDRKTGALKQLQGHIWKAKHAPLKGHVYDDVPNAFEEWTNSGKKLYIYSSGSVEAQRLLFGDSVHGDLLKYLSGHFDTEVGPKQDADSYKNILKQINIEPENALFLTDIIQEAEAAKAAGLSTTVVIREGNAKLSDEEKLAFKTIESFGELTFSSANKRQKIEDESTAEKKDAPKEENQVAAADEAASEPMDTSEDVEGTEKKSDQIINNKVVESKVEGAEKIKESEKPMEKEEKIEKEVMPMEEDAKTEEKTATKTETLKTDEPVIEAKETEEKIETVVEEKSNTEVSAESEKKVVETENKLEKTETEEKSKETTKETENVAEEMKVEAEKVKEAVQKETEEVVENVAEKVTEKVVEEIAEKVAEETAESKKSEEVKPEEKEIVAAEKKPTEEVKENGDAKVTVTEKVINSTEDKVGQSDNKENVATKVEKITEPEVEVAEEAKEVEKEKEQEDKAKPDSETQKDESKKLNGTTTNGDSSKDVAGEKVHSNGVSEPEKTKENGDAEESLKVKKAVADGAGEPDVVTPPVVAATS